MQSIGIADKMTLDEVKQDTSRLLDNFHEGYINISTSGVYTGSISGFQPVLDVTGEGFISKALIASGGSGNKGQDIRITIDGNIVVLARVLEDYFAAGICHDEFIQASNVGTSYNSHAVTRVFTAVVRLFSVYQNGLLEVPFDTLQTDGQNGKAGVSVLYDVLRFNNSCKIEMSCGTKITQWDIRGGAKIG